MPCGRQTVPQIMWSSVPVRLLLGTSLIATACGSTTAGPTSSPTSSPVSTETLRPNDSDAPFDLDGGANSDDSAAGTGSVDQLGEVVRSAVITWPTDWSRTTIDLGELAAGIPRLDPRDAIPPIDHPEFERPEAAAEWLDPDEPGAVVRLDGQTRFYPLSIMTRHEIVNDRFGPVPVAVTYCPLCNTALAFDRRVDGKVARLGVSGLLRNSDLVMWDDLTVSLWQQITGEGIVGEFAGTRLKPISTSIVSFGQFTESFPDGWVLSRNTGFNIGYGANPYRGYSSRDEPYPSFFSATVDGRFPALERVVGVRTDGADKAYPFSVLEERVVINDVAGEVPVVVWWAPGTTDALDRASIADSRAIGTAVAHRRELDGVSLTFSPLDEDGRFTDAETGSTWDVFGRAVAGELGGSQLEPIDHRNEFWFAWSAFFGDGEVYTAE